MPTGNSEYLANPTGLKNINKTTKINKNKYNGHEN
jgi:hypothetical protein